MTFKFFTTCWMSGTGNSRRVALWLEDAARSRGLAVREGASIRSPRTPVPPAEGDGAAESLVAFVYPTHGFTLPWAMLMFLLRRLPRGNGRSAVVVPTRAGTRIAGVCLPGLEGTGGYLAALILALRGWRVRGMQAVDMPSNWTAFHWGLHPDNCVAIAQRAERRARAFAESLLSGNRRFAGIPSLAVGILLLPVSIAYLLYGRFFLAKMYFANRDCTACGLCAMSCPFGAIRMRPSRQGGMRPFWTLQCENCMRCMAYCPERAVEAGHSFAPLLLLAGLMGLAGWGAARLRDAGAAGLAGLLEKPVVSFVIDYAWFLIALVVVYRLLQFALRAPFLERLFSLTTLTHYWRRYHEPSAEVSDFGDGLGQGSRPRE